MEKIVVSLCDFTGNMVLPWAEAGYECYCVDVKHGIRNDKIRDFHNGGKIVFTWGDVRSWTPPNGKKIKILFAFPPCTDVANSGARDFERKRCHLFADALFLFDACNVAGAYSGAPYMIENPVGRLSSYRLPDHRFHPCEYGGYLTPPGDAYTKKTCLWTGNGFVMPPKKPVEPVEGSKMHLMPPSDDRAAKRAETPMGFARAVFAANNTSTIN
jgi:hypothetical protein